MPKEPTLTETIQALRDAKASLELIGSNIQALLERYDNVNLPTKILKEAKRSRVARIRTAWLQTQFGFGYVRAAIAVESSLKLAVLADVTMSETRLKPGVGLNRFFKFGEGGFDLGGGERDHFGATCLGGLRIR